MRALPKCPVGIACLCAVIWIFSGPSDLPIVSTLLTSLITLLGAAGMFYMPWPQTTANGTATQLRWRRLSWRPFIDTQLLHRAFARDAGTLALLVLVSALISPATPLQAQTGSPAATSFIAKGRDCGAAEVRKVYRTSRPPKGEKINSDDRKDVQLEDIITIEIAGLDALMDCAAKLNRPVILYLDSRPFPSLTPYIRTGDSLVFDLAIHRTEGATPEPWDRVLGKPSLTSRPVPVSVGLAEEGPITSGQEVRLDPIASWYFILWVVIFGLLIIAFGLLMRRTTILRNGLTDPEAPDAKGSFSLAKSQAAWWFFFILASYILIGTVTGDFTGSVNATALTLLGIGGATAALGAMIDSQNPEAAAAQRGKSLADKKVEEKDLTDEIATLEGEINSIKVTITAAEQAIKAMETDNSQADLQAKQDTIERKRKELTDQRTEAEEKRIKRMGKEGRLAAVRSQIRKLRGESEGFWQDIVSDANGVSFHRFQMVAWTILLSLVFVLDVYKRLAMPTFDATLLGLMGISSATYLGLKTTEPTTPTK